MCPDTFDRQIELVRRRLESVEERARSSAEQRGLMLETLEGLSTALEELRIAAEELRQQNEELAAARQATEEQRQRYQELFQFAPDGYLVTDPDGVIYEANRAAAALLGVREEFLVGKPVFLFVSGESRAALYDQMRRFREATESVQDWEVSLQPRERLPLPASVAIGMVRDATGRLTGLRWLIRDITERKRGEEELRSARDQIRALATHRETTYEEQRSSVAWEAREDLAQVLATIKIDLSWISTMLREDQPAMRVRTRELLALLDSAMKSALQIARDLHPSPLDDLGLISAIAWQAQAFQRRTGIRCQLTSSLGSLALGPEQRTAAFRTFQEALSNVERHTGISKISIDLRVEAECLVLAVADDGREVAEGEDSNRESLGLLSIRERVYPLGGHIAVAGLPDGGMAVTVRIPLKWESGTTA
jgi:PAS domain S-box-containing protein